MENNNLKDMWKTNVKEDIKSYSECEMNELVIKCAKKSIRKIYPGIILKTIIFLITAFLLWGIITENENTPLIIAHFIVLSLLVGLMVVTELSARKMDQYNFDMPVKDWISNRIITIEKDIRFNRKNDILIYVGSLVLGFGIFVIYNYILNVPFNLLIYSAVFIVIALYTLGVRILVNKHYSNTLRNLQNLYKQIEQ